MDGMEKEDSAFQKHSLFKGLVETKRGNFPPISNRNQKLKKKVFYIVRFNFTTEQLST